jgi:hypothetical protein
MFEQWQQQAETQQRLQGDTTTHSTVTGFDFSEFDRELVGN